MSIKHYKVYDLVENDARPADGPDDYQRTTYMYIQNDTPASIKICFMQATCRYDLPAPYIKDTGTFIAGVNTNAGASIAVDPWYAGGINAPIAATAGNGTLKLEYAGVEYDVPLEDYAEAPDGNFYPQMGWRVISESSVSSTGKKKVTFTARIMATGLLQVKSAR